MKLHTAFVRVTERPENLPMDENRVMGNHPATELGKLHLSSRLWDFVVGANKPSNQQSVSWHDTAVWEIDLL
jgi:hypothetical protein